MRVLTASDSERVMEALTVAYLTFRELETTEDRSGTHVERSLSEVAGAAAVLGELCVDVDVIVAGILQKVVGGIDAHKRKRIELRVGNSSVALALAYLRMPTYGAKLDSYGDHSAEDHIQMLVAVSDDYRALYIRLAERTHVLRGLRRLCSDAVETRRVALEARHVYAPLAHKMGLMKVHAELEDAAFRVLEPDMFLQTRYTQTAAAKAYRDATLRVAQFIRYDPILQAKKAHLRLTHRIKSKYQLYRKMLRKGLSTPNDVRDALGLRVIVDLPRAINSPTAEHAQASNALCYYVVRGLRTMPGWEHARAGFKDYILHRKDNGYQSLHQYIHHLALGANVEVQVCTREQHRAAEVGEAAHWCYKDRLYRPEVAGSGLYQLAWRSPAQLQAKSPAELFSLARQQLRAARVFVYLPDTSTVLNLPKGSTVEDLAARVGVKVQNILINGQTEDYTRKLVMGDVISLVPAASQ
jgi:(p)ppGpp synthase/HD superfamily hydrolase